MAVIILKRHSNKQTSVLKDGQKQSPSVSFAPSSKPVHTLIVPDNDISKEIELINLNNPTKIPLHLVKCRRISPSLPPLLTLHNPKQEQRVTAPNPPTEAPKVTNPNY